MKRFIASTAIILCVANWGAVAARGQNQQQPAPAGSPAPAGFMDGMDMSKPAADGDKAGGCKMMGMDMGSGKQMDMSHCMAMMKGGKNDLAKIPPGTLRVTYGEKSNDLTVAALAALPHVTVTVHNEHTKADETYSGVPVIALLAPLGVTDKPRGKQLRLYVVASGSDGYEVVYSIGEVTPDVHDATVLVADQENGKPLMADGPLKLVATGEKRPARWVRNLVEIDVRTAE